MEVSGQMTKWAVELSGYGIQYAPKPAIKAQILAYFIAEGVVREDTQKGTWEVYVGGAVSKHGAGAGVVVRTPAGVVHEIAIRFRSLQTNNATEYEAVLPGLAAARDLGAMVIRVLSDSALVVNQLNGIFDAKENTLTLYIEQVKRQATLFEVVTYVQILWEENIHADALLKLETATDFYSTRLGLVQKEDPEHQQVNTINATQVAEEGDWRTPKTRYLNDGSIPDDPKETWALRQKASRCTLIGNEFHRLSAHIEAYNSNV
ncbi:unnamed protein product [Linum trigynum]|uniref:RNase H type-1 domain-containing protein n=1 Tax=Linum trigynum TaxID=586398 RepID=A0AAV2EPP9_9ROSI